MKHWRILFARQLPKANITQGSTKYLIDLVDFEAYDEYHCAPIKYGKHLADDLKEF